MAVEFGEKPSSLTISDILASTTSEEALQMTRDFVSQQTSESKASLLENETFISMAGAIINNADTAERRQEIAKEISSSFGDDQQLEAYDFISKHFGLRASVS